MWKNAECTPTNKQTSKQTNTRIKCKSNRIIQWLLQLAFQFICFRFSPFIPMIVEMMIMATCFQFMWTFSDYQTAGERKIFCCERIWDKNNCLRWQTQFHLCVCVWNIQSSDRLINYHKFHSIAIKGKRQFHPIHSNRWISSTTRRKKKAANTNDCILYALFDYSARWVKFIQKKIRLQIDILSIYSIQSREW